ncbi:uncharacterized protein LOC126848031 [Adelges cooleyi]|uniref:uncharacterized protein LOC126848031 n=1 Tax=Adelges cooleyi TaxID=133065 RepID=UPI00217F76EC|nr:uncharacterized protein LOC126848031 [Adelges cooleyi]
MPTLDDGERVVVTSGYLPYQSTDPSRDLTKLINYCKQEKLELILGMDANAHHIVWESSDTNQRGGKLMDFLITTNLSILNKGSEPTSITRNRKEVIDITVCSKGLVQRIEEWRVSSEPSLSDHRHIHLALRVGKARTEFYRNPKRTNCYDYRDALTRNLGSSQYRFGSQQAIEQTVKSFQASIESAYEESCPSIEKKGLGQGIAWWSAHLSKFRKSTRRLLNKAIKSDLERNWEVYRTAQREYKSEIKRSKRRAGENSVGMSTNFPRQQDTFVH